MDKFNQLLNENTIVDFRLLWKLALRYRGHLIIAFVLFCTIFSYNYYVQPIIYAVNVPLKAISNHTVAQDLSALLPVDNANAVNLSELKISMENYSFLKSFSEMVIADPEFDKFNLGPVTTNKNIYGKDLAKNCGIDKECLVAQLVNILRGAFQVEQGLTENRFILTVNAREKQTVQKITSILLKALELNRVHVRQYLVLKEIQSVSKLIAESRSIMQKMDGYKALEDQEKLQNNIFDLKERIRMLQGSSSQEMANLTTLESRLSENKKSTRRKVAESREEFEFIQKAQARLIEIKQNIIILTNLPEDKRTDTDKSIVTQLKAERERLSRLLPPETHRKIMEMTENFVEGQRNKSGDYEFDYQVAKNKLEKLNKDYEASKSELNEMLQEKILNENKVVGMKADLDFLKNLESKLMSLKLLNATMTSDIYFEDVSSVAKEYRQSTYLKIFLFSFAITLFLYLFSILIRFFMDDRIYGEEEIRSHLKNLDFVGEVPLFD